jgi:Trypsin-like peptidase domain
MEAEKARWTRSVIRVSGGRGFVVGTDDERFIITAAHCLPHFPPGMSFSSIEERTYAELLGSLGRKRTPVWAECCFVDPIADLAVLWSPDRRHLDKEADRFDALVGAAVPLPIGDLPLTRPPIILPAIPMWETTPVTILGRPIAECKAWLLSLGGHWFRCDVTAGNRALTVVSVAEKLAGGMSGSPIVSDDGKAIGVAVATPGDTAQPFLARQLPRWLIEKIPLSVAGAPPPPGA